MRERVSWLLDHYKEPALVEEFLPGREFTVAILGNGEEARVLPIVEILFDSLPQGVNPIYSYEAKWIWDQSSNPLKIFECPAKISAELQSEIESACLKATVFCDAATGAGLMCALIRTGVRISSSSIRFRASFLARRTIPVFRNLPVPQALATIS
jgi:D-alanine-D-alanine ligase-like ATP-grasp enzyme